MAAFPETMPSDDLSALAWVQAELRRSLETAQKSLRRYLKESESAGRGDLDAADPAALRTARAQLHQGAGALELVGLPAPARVLRAAESAVQKLLAKPALVDEHAVQVIEHVAFALLDYLSRTLAGKQLSPVSLFPQYRDALTLAGSDRIHPADLWELDFRWHELPDEPEVLPRRPEDAGSLMETIVLGLMRHPDARTWTRMSDLCVSLAAASRGRLATLWKLAAAFAEGEAEGLIPRDLHTKRMAARLLAQLRLNARQHDEPSDRLAQDLLFYCANSRAPASAESAPRLSAVRATWQLGSGPSIDYESVRLGRFDPAVIAQARKRVSGAKDVWSAVAGGELHRLTGLTEQFALLCDSVEKLFPSSEALVKALQDAASRVHAQGEAPPPALAMEVATSVLYLDATLEDGELDHPQLAERVQRLAQRIVDVQGGAEPHPLEPWMEELYRRVSDRQTMGSVVHELRASLSEIEKQIDQYFRDPTQRALLIPVPSQLSAMRGVLSVLGMDQASQAVLHMRDDVDALAATEVDAQMAIKAGTFDRLADNLGALSFLIDMLSVQPQLAKSLFRFDPAEGSLRAVMGQSERVSAFGGLDGAADDSPLVEEARALAQTAAAQPMPQLSTELERLSQQALAADRPAIAGAISQARTALNEAADDQARREIGADLARSVEDLAQRPAAAAPAAPAQPVPQSGALEDDAEMREIFLEEATEVIDAARASLTQLADAPEDVGELTTVRRAFHTLKGSSRMVGLRDFGEAAWACEQLYNARLAQSARMDAPLARFTGEALDYLSTWTGAIAEGHGARFDPAPVIRAADSLRVDGVPMAIAAAVAAAAAVPSDAGLAAEAAPEFALPAVAEAAEPLPTLTERVPDLPSAGDLELAPPQPVTAVVPEVPAFEFDLDTGESAAHDDVPAPALPAEPASPSLPEVVELDFGAFAPAAPSAPEVADEPALPRLTETVEAGAEDYIERTLPLADLAIDVGPHDSVEHIELPELTEVVGGASPSEPAELAALDLSEPEIELDFGADAQSVAARDTPIGETAPSGDDFLLPPEWAVDDSEPDLLASPPPGAAAAASMPELPALHEPAAGALEGIDLDFGEATAAPVDAGPSDESFDPLPGQEAELPALAMPSMEAPVGEMPAADMPVVQTLVSPIPAIEAEDRFEGLTPEPAGDAPVAADVAPEPELPEDEQVKVIGSLRISIPLFNIYLNEADELSRRLSTELAEWGLEHERRVVPDSTVALAHSLAGSSATVGYTELSMLARALEHALMRSAAVGRGSEGEPALFGEAAEEIRRLLHQFAAGFLKPMAPGLLDRLAEHERALAHVISDVEAEALDFDEMREEPAEPASEPADADVESDQAAVAAGDAASTETAEAAERAEAEAAAPVGLPTEGPALVPVQALSPTFGALETRDEQAAPVGGARADAFDDDEDIDAEDAVDDELFPIFEEEAEELLPQLQARLRDWMLRPSDREAAAACMRTLHTFKGGARLAGAMRLGEMAHRLETAVEHLAAQDELIADRIEPLMGRADRMAATFDILRKPTAPPMVATPAVQPTPVELALPPEPAVDAASLAAADAALPVADGESPVDEVRAVARPPIDWTRFTGAQAAAIAVATGERPGAAGSAAVRVRSGLLDRLVNHAGEVSITRARIDSGVRQIQGSLNDLTDNLDRLRRQLRDIELQAETQIASRIEAAKASSQAFDPLEMDRFTRFQELTRMMAESVNDVATVQRSVQRTLQSTEDELAAQTRLTRELQDDLLRTRMVEFESLADRLYRVVRQAAKESGKQVRLDIVGGAIEVDRGVLERMVGPFEHLLRNSVAHGIESPAQRLAAGKDGSGAITVVVTQEGNEIGVECRDDGAGLDLERIRQRAIERGLLQADQAAGDGELANLIFMPGFSTATEVSELAGRGVGLDVVRSEANAMGGRIETASTTGQGTSFKLVLPLTTAVTQVVMVRSGELRVAVPSTLVEIVRRVPTAQVEASYAAGVYAGEEQTIPFYWLGALLQHSARGPSTGRTQAVVIVRSASQRVALHVDEVLGNQEVVVKHVGPQLARLPGLVGVTLLPSGAVALIYNPVALAALYGDAARQRAAMPQVDTRITVPAEAAEPEAPLVLVVDDSLTVRRVTQRLLVREGYRVALAKDGLDALEKLAQERPAVMLSDIEMPRMDGFDLVRNVRADARLAGLPVIMITSRIAQKHRDYARELGVDHYLGKPYSEEDLLGLVSAYAGQRQAA